MTAADLDTMMGRAALITGASAGIGAALARELAREGLDVVLTARREEPLRALAREIEGMGRRALVVRCDVTRDGDLERAVAAAIDRFGRLDIAVANAGFGVAGRVDELTVEDYRRQLETNVFGVLRTLYATLPELKKTRGQFVIIGSVSGHVPTPATSAYSMSKFAVRGLAESIHDELAAHGVAVTLVSPGFVDSDIRRTDNRGAVHAAAPDPIPGWLRMPTDRAARVIARAIRRRRREIVVTGHGKAIVFLYRHAPWLLNFAIARFGAPKRRAIEQPIADPTDVPGERRERKDSSNQKLESDAISGTYGGVVRRQDSGMRIVSIGHAVFAAVFIAIGIQGVKTAQFTAVWQPVPVGIPGREALACTCAFVSLGAGIALFFRWTQALAARVLLAALIVWLLAWRVRALFLASLIEGTWSFADTLVMTAGAWVLFAWFATDRDRRHLAFASGTRGLRIARVFYGIGLLPFGYAHFANVKGTASLVPAWLPGHVAFAYLTGAAFIVAGVAIIADVLARWAARLSVLQMGLFGLIVWVPVLARGSANAFQWMEFWTTVTLTAAGWVVGDSWRRASPGA